ncbi:MAG: protein-L-isoaspartate(D-aspartate) O-methyltransferase [Myxococcota bacterium]|nr:protein-L-isoaspartate(D-aspartate) O-methyltransferase [Myxococcota bacterium]
MRLLWLWLGCTGASVPVTQGTENPSTETPGTEYTGGEQSHDGRDEEARMDGERADMVEQTIRARGVEDARVLAAMETVPRHRFVPRERWPHAYEDRPLPIGENQTISQPYIVALMTELAGLEPGDRVLEVGTGSGYQAAVLAQMGVEVWTIEIVAPLAADAARDLEATGYADRVHAQVGDGYRGWPDQAPFDAIIVTAAPDHIPEPLQQQLKVGARLVIPVGDLHQELLVLTRTEDGWDRQSVLPVRFVPMTGEALQGQD